MTPKTALMLRHVMLLLAIKLVWCLFALSSFFVGCAFRKSVLVNIQTLFGIVIEILRAVR